MKIASIDVYPLKTDLENPIGFSQWYYSAKNNLVVKITAQDGTVGWGECYGPCLLYTSPSPRDPT